jgi:hypothetical protein
MDRSDRERDTDATIADATGMERSDDEPAMPPAKELADGEAEATGGEKTEVEGMSGVAATHRAFGGGTAGSAGGIGTHVPTDEDEHVTRPGDRQESEDATDPRGY